MTGQQAHRCGSSTGTPQSENGHNVTPPAGAQDPHGRNQGAVVRTSRGGRPPAGEGRCAEPRAPHKAVCASPQAASRTKSLPSTFFLSKSVCHRLKTSAPRRAAEQVHFKGATRSRTIYRQRIIKGCDRSRWDPGGEDRTAELAMSGGRPGFGPEGGRERLPGS